jgi:hypothetical protein
MCAVDGTPQLLVCPPSCDPDTPFEGTHHFLPSLLSYPALPWQTADCLRLTALAEHIYGESLRFRLNLFFVPLYLLLLILLNKTNPPRMSLPSGRPGEE